jgi:hypothetical protein
MKFEPPKINDYSESQHQKLCVEYADRHPWGPLLICIPNGAHLAGDSSARSRQMNHLKAMGLKPGTSDLFLAMPVKQYHGAWFEMKKIGARKPSPEQYEFLLRMERQGYYVDVCYGFDEWRYSAHRYFAGQQSLLGAEDNTV